MQQFFANKIVRFILSAGVAVFLYWACPPCLNHGVLGAILAGLLLIINLPAVISYFPLVTHIVRVVVGITFIYSGFIKSNDPIGFAYKLEEYFEVFSQDLANSKFLVSMFHWMADWSVFFAILVCVSEVALGFMLLTGLYKRLTLWLLLAQIVFFTFLTFYSACYNKVTHCGCFGDAIVLTPWQSFTKDIALCFLISILWVGERHIKPVFGSFLGKITIVVITGISIAFPVYTWAYLPVKDYRPYAPGKNICEQMKPGPHYKQAEFGYLYKNKKNGTVQAFPADKLPWKDSLTWVYDTVQLIHPAVDEPLIVDFKITDPETQDDLTDSVLKNPDYYFLLVAYDLKHTNRKVQGRINDFVGLCDKDKKKFMALTSAPHEEIRDFRLEVQAAYPYLNGDQTMLKTMIRSNPGLMLMKGCTVIANWPFRSFPSYNDVKAKYFNNKEK
ncbi:MAG: BT_3928 family protein [Bacteroidia bacterium]